MNALIRTLNILYPLSIIGLFAAIFNGHTSNPHCFAWTMVGMVSWLFGYFGPGWIKWLERKRDAQRDLQA